MIKSEDLMQQLLQTFRAEASEHLQNLNLAVLGLEVRPEEAKRHELVQEAFRSAHSLKGAARTVGLEAVEKTAHAMEAALQKVRDTASHLEASTCDALYDSLDAITALLAGNTVDIEPLINRLVPVNDAPPIAAPLLSELPTKSVEPAKTSVPEISTEVQLVVENVMEAKKDLPVKSNVSATEDSIRVSISKLDDLMAQVGELLVSRINAEQRVTEFRSIRQHLIDWSKTSRELRSLVSGIDTYVGNRLVEMFARFENQFERTLHDITEFDQKLRQDTVRLRVITSQLQDNARHVRMVPFETLVPSLQRTVRDAAHSEHKQVVFEVIGGEVELDKKVLEALKDPFIHMLRNAVGHGIEAEETRIAQGKTAEGHVTLTLQQRGSEVRISIEDDGGGFDLKALHRAGTESGVPLSPTVENDQAIIEMAFLPGVTTTQAVTSLSGRGVGLDVVRERVEELQGHIEVESVAGEGAHIHLLVPSSLTISRGLLVQVGPERYVLPLLSVLKIFTPQDFFTVAGQTMLTIEGVTMPVVSLAALLGRSFSTNNDQPPLAVIMAVAEQRLVLLVDDVVTELELAVKPLTYPLRRVHNVAGAALMGDGKPVVVLNASDLLRAAKGAVHRQPLLIRESDSAMQKYIARILVVDDSITTRTLEKSILETAGYDVVTATDGVQALQRLDEQHIDLVVSDVEMPNMNGIKLTETLRENRAYMQLPVILVTSLESKEDRERGMFAGANAYIVKRGFDQGELLRTVEQLVFIEDD